MSEPAVPQSVGKFPVSKLLGEGAMGRVYLGEDPDIGRSVAIKVVASAGDEDSRARFLNEARAAGQLSHPNIVHIYEFGFHEERPYLAMEFLEGDRLDEWLKKGRRHPREKMAVLLGLCRAVEHAHSRGILHRDIKPSNLQVLPDGSSKLLDFGIARMDSVRMTATGMVLGTPEYIAPEVLREISYSPRTDNYAVGLVAYSTLSGHSPFRAGNLEACLHRVLSFEPEPLKQLAPHLPDDLCHAVDRQLLKDPDDRPEGLGSLMEALERAAATFGQTTELSPTVALPAPGEAAAPSAPESKPPAAGKGGGRRWLIAAAGVVVAAGALYWAIGRETAVLPTSGAPERGVPQAPAAEEAPVASGAAQQATPPPGEADGSSLEGRPPEPVAASEDEAPSPPRQEPVPTRARPDPTSPGSTADGVEAQATGTDAERPPRSPSAAAQERTSDRGDPHPPTAEDPRGSGTPERREEPEAPAGHSPAAAGGTDSPSPPPPATDEPHPGAREAETVEPRESAPPPTADLLGEPEAPVEDTVGDTVEGTAEAPAILRILPSTVRRGGKIPVIISSTGLGEKPTAVFRRGDRPTRFLSLRGLRRNSRGELSGTLSVRKGAPLGVYTLSLRDASGRESNAIRVEVRL